MKPLLKSLRQRHRYIFFKIETLSDHSFGEKQLQHQIWFESQNLLGDVFSGEAWMDLIELNMQNGRGTGILKCSHDNVKKARAVLACIHKVKKDKVGIWVLGVSGTIKSGKKKFIE